MNAASNELVKLLKTGPLTVQQARELLGGGSRADTALFVAKILGNVIETAGMLEAADAI